MKRLLLVFFGILISQGYILPAWKIVDLMWQNPFHLRGSIVKARIVQGDEQMESGTQFLIIFDLAGDARFVNISAESLFSDARAVFRTIFATGSQEEFMRGLQKLNVNLEKVGLDRYGGIVAYVLGNESTTRLWIDKEALVPLRIENKDWEVSFQKFKEYSAGLFPSVIGLRRFNKASQIIFVDEVSFLDKKR